MTGSVIYRERIGLTPAAVIQIEVVELTQEGSPGTVIAQQTIQSPGQVPIPFTVAINPQRVRAGDMILLNGDVGRHGIAIMAAREGLEFETAIESDCAPLAELVLQLIAAGVDIHCLRDLTRGGLTSARIMPR